MMRNEVLVLLFIITLTTQYFKGSQSTQFTIQNKCGYTVWPATLAGGGIPPLSSTGFELRRGATTSLDVASGWSGRIWGRSSCSIDTTGKFRCDTGDCGSGQVTCNGAGGIPPASLMEITLARQANGLDFYDISLVDGYNLPLAVTPQGGSGQSCKAISCRANLNPTCPRPLQLKNSRGSVIGCQSACAVFKQPQYCCTGAYGSPGTCHPTTYSNYFKGHCPQAYSYAYDDATSTFTCNAGANYLITFCP